MAEPTLTHYVYTLLSANWYMIKKRNGGMLMLKTFHHKEDQKHVTRTMSALTTIVSWLVGTNLAMLH